MGFIVDTLEKENIVIEEGLERLFLTFFSIKNAHYYFDQRLLSLLDESLRQKLPDSLLLSPLQNAAEAMRILLENDAQRMHHTLEQFASDQKTFPVTHNGKKMLLKDAIIASLRETKESVFFAENVLPFYIDIEEEIIIDLASLEEDGISYAITDSLPDTIERI